MVSALQLSFVDPGGALQVLAFDAVLTENHHHAAKVTQFPVETGAVISDHVIQEPDQVRLEVLATDTPMPSALGLDPETYRAQARVGQFLGRSTGLYRQVVELKAAGTPVTLTSTVHTYESMVVESVELPVDASRGDGAQFTIALRHVEQVGLRTVPVPKIEKAGPKVSKGKLATRSAEAKPDSIARQAKKALVGG